MILLSAHRDTIKNNYRLRYEKGEFIGLLDNWIGVFIVNLLLFDDPNIARLEKDGDLKIFMGDSEEWGTITPLPHLDDKDIVLVIDVETGKKYDKYDFAFVNISGFQKKEIRGLCEHLKWEGFSVLSRFYDGDKNNEDEAWQWRKKGIRVISIVIPCNDAGKTGWHVDNCSISYEKVVICKEAIKRIINYLL